jgi:GNAT superfamily N-acetyltransferase
MFAGGAANWPLTIGQLVERVAAETSDAFTVVYDTGIVVGHLEFVRETADRVRLARIAIAPDLRGQGLIARLLERASDHAREAGFRWVSLLVVPDNSSALRAYARAGFVDVGVSVVHPDYVRMMRRV